MGLLVALLVAFEQVNLHLYCVNLLLATARPALPLVFLLPLLDVLYVKSDAFAQLDEGLCHVGGDVTDDDTADGHVNDGGADKVGHPESKDSDEQVLSHDLNVLN